MTNAKGTYCIKGSVVGFGFKARLMLARFRASLMFFWDILIVCCGGTCVEFITKVIIFGVVLYMFAIT